MIVNSIRLRKQGLVVPAAAVLSALAFVLTGCSSSGSLSGEYYDNDGQLVIDGSAVAYYEFGCDKANKGKVIIDSEPTSSGELSKGGDQIIWSAGEGTGRVTASKSGDTVDIDGKQYTKMDRDKALQSRQSMCGS